MTTDPALSIFDGLNLEEVSNRRIAFFPLYEYYRKLLLNMGVTYYGLNKPSFISYSIKGRWDTIKPCLILLHTDVNRWDSVVKRLQEIRSKVEHDDNYIPNKEDLEIIRHDAPDFKKWLILKSKEYYKHSKEFSYKQFFFHHANRYIAEAKEIIEHIHDSPALAKELGIDDFPIDEINDSIRYLEERLVHIAHLEEIENSDFHNLFNLIEYIYRFKGSEAGSENIFLQFSVCPNCGGKIETTEHSFGGSEDDPEPTSINYRVGCNKCDYVLNEENIDV